MTDGDMIGRAGLLAMLATRAAELRELARLLRSAGDAEMAGRLDAKVGEVEWVADMVAQWGSKALAEEGGGDGS